MNENKNNSEFSYRIKKELDGLLENLDPTVEKRLLAARQSALNQPVTSWRDRFRLTGMIPVTGFAAALVVLMAVSLWYTTRPQLAENKVDELEILTITASLDMYKDLEMLQWLAETDDKS